jgi:hypothetical protein
MKTVLSLLLLATAAAGPAAAQDIRINISGKSPADIREDIGRAAQAVCDSAFRDQAIGFTELNACVRAVSDDGLRQARALTAKPA